MTYGMLVSFNFDEIVYNIGNLIVVFDGALIFNQCKEHRRTCSSKRSLFTSLFMFAFLAVVFFSCILSFCYFIVIRKKISAKQDSAMSLLIVVIVTIALIALTVMTISVIVPKTMVLMMMNLRIGGEN